MAKKSNQKLKLLYLLKILSEQTDGQRSMTLSQLSDELAKYGIESGRKSLYDDIEVLKVFGFNVYTKRDRYVRYYLKDKRFDSAESKLLTDFIFESDLLSERKKNELLKKFVGIASFSEPVQKEEKIANTAVRSNTYKNIETICNAISENKCITFKRFEWNANKQRILIGGGEVFSVSPWGLVLCGKGYKLIAFDNTRKMIAVFDPSRLLDVSLSTKKREGEKAYLNFSFAEGESDNIRLACDNSMAGEIIDRFGIDVTVLANREDYFEISVKTLINDAFYSWIFSTRGKVKILSPVWVLDDYSQMLVEGRCEGNEKI